MTIEFVSLKCPSCAGRLDVYHDMERFACGYCGAEALVDRRGGSVSLKCLTAVIENVQRGTDKTAAELALIRLQKELVDLQDQLPGLAENLDYKRQWADIYGREKAYVNSKDHPKYPYMPWIKTINKESYEKAVADKTKELEAKRELAHKELDEALLHLTQIKEQLTVVEQRIVENRKLVDG